MFILYWRQVMPGFIFRIFDVVTPLCLYFIFYNWLRLLRLWLDASHGQDFYSHHVHTSCTCEVKFCNPKLIIHLTIDSKFRFATPENIFFLHYEPSDVIKDTTRSEVIKMWFGSLIQVVHGKTGITE